MSETSKPHSLEAAADRAGAMFSGIASGAKGLTTHLSTWVGVTSAMIGGFIALDTYQKDVAKSVDQSVAKTFDMVESFNGERLASARMRALSYVEAKRFCDSRMISRDLMDADFVTVVDFFDLVHACVNAQLCDGKTAHQFFAPYANYQWPVLSVIVEDIRSQPQSMRADAGFGEGMKALAANPVAAPPCDGNF